LKKVIVSVTNDLSTDQRVDKVCTTLTTIGFDVKLIGRKLPDSLPLSRPYMTHRMKLFFRKGPFFYAEYNIRLFLYLLFSKSELLVSNDLDTLPANYLVHKLKRIPLVYDSHEYYTETPELVNRPLVKNIWEKIEGCIFPKLTDIITVNESIAGMYEAKYSKQLFVVRNIPVRRNELNQYSRKELGLDPEKHLIILQGAGINIQRGAEEAIAAMKYVADSVLLIVGGGDVIDHLKKQVIEEELTDRVMFMPKMPYSELMKYTAAAEIGLTLDKDTNINYRYSLPNKLFDYIHAGTPVLASPLPEIKKIVEEYNIGLLTENHNPEHIADRINFMISNDYKSLLRKNLEKAASELNWQNEEKQLKLVYSKYAG